MTKPITILLSTCLLIALPTAYATYGSYAERYCAQQDQNCFVTHSDDSWNSLWPDPQQREVAKRINRMNTRLHPGMQLIDPDQLSAAQLDNLQPFPNDIGAKSTKTIIVDPNSLAWGAYDENGQLVRWGAASAARGYCPDAGTHCTTPTGTFTVYSKEGAGCFSRKFPVGRGGAPMPYCMFFKGGYALHGSYEVPGYNDSHGCVRIFPEDAEWLNHEFVHTGATQVVVKPH